MACLDRGRAALSAVADLITTADAGTLPGVASAARAVPDPDTCSDARDLASDVEPPSPAQAALLPAVKDDIERARVQLAAGNADQARLTAARAVAVARGIGYRPLLAEALLVEGRARTNLDDRDSASTSLREATTLALSTGSDAVAIEAWGRQAKVEGTGPEPDMALDGLAVIDALALRTPSAFARAVLHNSVGSVELGRGHPDRARAMFERALDDARYVTGSGRLEMIKIRSNLALATDEPVRRDALLRGAYDELARLLGENHPEAIAAQFIRAMTSVISFAQAADLITAVCQQRQLLRGLTNVTAECWLEAADLRSELGDRTAALAALDRAERFGSDTNPQTREAAGYRALWRGNADAAITALAAQLTELPQEPKETWYRAYARARLSLAMGRALAAQHRLAPAAESMERAIEVFEPLIHTIDRVAIRRRLGRARAELVRVRVAAGAPPARTRELAAAALEWLLPAGAPPAELAELERLAAVTAH